MCLSHIRKVVGSNPASGLSSFENALIGVLKVDVR